MGALHVVLCATSFEDGIVTNTLAGGDNCSRGTAVGAVLGARFGVPPALAARMADAPSIAALVAEVRVRGGGWVTE